MPNRVGDSAARALLVAQAATRGEGAPNALEVGKPVERELAGGGAHAYAVTVEAGQFLHIIVEQRGVDVVVALFAPDGKRLQEVDSPNGTQGAEPLKWVAKDSGVFRLEVRSLE
ncbi:MAG: hypothetical protein LC774_07735, partial [Acidobacteria bacterium]|nr:hypothetical protein [Acidobacteriota bacterium]